MPFFLFQARYTSAAIKAMIDRPQDREAAARPLVEAVGGKLHSLFFCFGSDDVMAIVEAPDDRSFAAASLALGASGAFSGGRTTKLMDAKEAMSAMKLAADAARVYKPATA